MNGVVKNKKSLALIMIITVAAAAVMGISISSCQKEETINIGAILSITGPGSQSGGDLRDAMLLAVEEINSRGGLNRKKIKLIIEDSQSKAQVGKDAFNKIEAAYHPVLFISNMSSVSISLTPMAEQEDVVLVGLVVSAEEFTGQSEWIFRYYTTAETEVSLLLNILSDLKVNLLGMLYLNDDYGRSVSEKMKEGFEWTGGKVVQEAFEPGESDFKGHIEKLKISEAITTVGFVSHLMNILKRLKDEDYEGPVLTTSPGSAASIRKLPEANGLYLAAPVIYNPNFLFAQAAREKYEAKYSKAFNHWAANGYDFINILAGLLEDKEVSRKSVKRVLEAGCIYSGVFGTLNVQPGEHNITIPLHPAQIVDGEIKYLR